MPSEIEQRDRERHAIPGWHACCLRAQGANSSPKSRTSAKAHFSARLLSSPASARCSADLRPTTRITKTISATRCSGRRSSSRLCLLPRLSRRSEVRALPLRSCPHSQWPLPPMPPSAFTITHAACFAGPAARKHLIYNIMYGPPIFAPLLFGAAGMLGILASLLRRRRA